jgi:hypothetical protein
MNFIYCQSCFKKTPQTIDIVKFCAHCGKSFSISQGIIDNRNKSTDSLSSIIKRKAIKTAIFYGQDDEDNENNDIEEDLSNQEEIQSVPNIQKLEIEVDIPKEPVYTVGSIAKGLPRKAREKQNIKPIDKEKFLEEFLKSASSLRK